MYMYSHICGSPPTVRSQFSPKAADRHNRRSRKRTALLKASPNLRFDVMPGTMPASYCFCNLLLIKRFRAAYKCLPSLSLLLAQSIQQVPDVRHCHILRFLRRLLHSPRMPCQIPLPLFLLQAEEPAFHFSEAPCPLLVS